MTGTHLWRRAGSMGTDKDFYDLWDEQDKPEDDQKIALDAAKIKSKKFNLDRRIYIVRGYDMFVVHADDVVMGRNADGSRNIEIKNSRMIKYTEDGQRLAD